MGGGTVLAPVDFFAGLRKGLKASLASEYRRFNSARGRGRLMKVNFGNPAFHYEAWHHTGAGRLEIGLHFESAPDDNARAFEFFRGRMLEVKDHLPHAELEPWDRGWVRLYETIPAASLDDSVLRHAVSLMAAYIAALQPLVERLAED